MAAEKCWKCGLLRKVDIIHVGNGWNQPPCYHCGDPGYFEPDNNRGKWEHVFGSIEEGPEGWFLRIQVRSKFNGISYACKTYIAKDQEGSFDKVAHRMIRYLDLKLDESEYSK